MRLLFILILCLDHRVWAQLSSESCSLLRTITSLSNIVPEMIQLAMRSYRASDSLHQRQKRFVSPEILLKSVNVNPRGSLMEQMIANTISDVNFTSVALLMLQNNDTMNKVQQNIDMDLILRTLLRGVDQEKLAMGIWHAASKEFDLEHFISNIINRTQLDTLHEQLMSNGTLPEWALKVIHPQLNNRILQGIFLTIKNVTMKFIRVIHQYERVDRYLFNMIIDQALTPINSVIRKVQQGKPKNFDQLLETLASSANQAVLDQFDPSTPRTTTKKSPAKLVTSTMANEEEEEDLTSMLYQWSVAFNAMGQTTHIVLKSLEQLYCPAG